MAIMSNCLSCLADKMYHATGEHGFLSVLQFVLGIIMFENGDKLFY